MRLLRFTLYFLSFFVCLRSNLCLFFSKLRCRAVIGENFEFQDDICGVVAQPRQQKDKVAIWLTRCDAEPRLRGIGEFAHAKHFPI